MTDPKTPPANATSDQNQLALRFLNASTLAAVKPALQIPSDFYESTCLKSFGSRSVLSILESFRQSMIERQRAGKKPWPPLVDVANQPSSKEC